MGLLTQTQTYGLLNKELPTTPQVPSVANSTSQTSFDINAPITPRFAQQPIQPKPIKLTGATTLSQGKLSPLEKVKNAIPSGYTGDIARGLLDVPKTIAKEAGLLDEEGIVKLDRLAQSLIEKGTDPTRAYDIAGADIQKGSLESNKAASDLYSKLNVTPDEEAQLRKARLSNAFMTGLTLSNLFPGAGAVAKDVGGTILKIAATKEESKIASHLLELGVPKEKIPTLATTLTGVTKPEVVTKIVQDAITVPKAGLLNKTIPTDDKATQQQLQNSIMEGKNILRAGSINGRKLTEDEIQQVTKTVVSPLEQEAKKYKSAEEFVKAQGTPVYHGTPVDNVGEFRVSKTTGTRGENQLPGIYTSENKFLSDYFAGKGRESTEAIIKGKILTAKSLPELKKQYGIQDLNNLADKLKSDGYDAVKFTQDIGGGTETVVINPKVLKTKSQLTDIWNKANETKIFTRTPEELAVGKEKLTKRLETTSISPKKVPQPEIIPERGATTMSQTEHIQSQLPSRYVEDVRSLPNIIERTVTDVKDKVNVLDYMRTPDRVLEKIGFKKEADAVRKGYEAYVKELPKNIDKITEWSKVVPKESNERIFKYLDGQKITLDAKETKVAGEIKDWLKEWATRLKLPEDNQITHYITHIFDKELIAKEFDEELAKLITDRLPGQVYDPFLEKRLGAMGYKQDTWAALDAYVKRATRKANMDDALEMIRSKAGETLEMSKIEASQFKYIQRYINNVNMRPTELDNLIDNSLKSVFGYKYGTRPVTAITKLLRQLTFRGMLGLNPGSALRNLSQGINTYAKLGEKHTIIGYSKLLSPHGRQEIIESGILADNFIQDRALSSTKKAIEKIDKGLFAMFDMAEKINRGAAFLGGKSKALAEGMSEEKAIEYGKKLVRDTQFNFGSIDTPVALQNDIVKTLTQFQTYTVKQIEFITEMAKNKEFVGLLRYALSGLAFVYTVGKAFNMTPEQIIPSFRFDTPPSLKLPTELIKAGLNTPDKYGQQRTLEQKASDIGQSAIGLIPGGSQAKKTIQGEELIRKGGSFDKGGNLQFEAPQTTTGKVQALLFGKYSGEKAQEYFDKPDRMKKDVEEMKPFYDNVQQLIKEGKDQEAQDMVDSLGDYGYEVYKKYKSQVKAEETKQGKQDILPTYNKVQQLMKEGREKEAQDIVDSLTDDQYKYYELLKKSIQTPKSGEIFKEESKAKSLKENILGALGVETASAMENKDVATTTPIDVPEKYGTALNHAYHRYDDLPKGIIETVLMMESSMGKDKTNATKDFGKFGYLGGLTKNGHFVDTLNNLKDEKLAKKIKISNVKGIDTLPDEYTAIQAIASSLKKVIANNPGMSLEDAYFKKYVTAPESDTKARRDLFRKALKQYSSTQTY